MNLLGQEGQREGIVPIPPPLEGPLYTWRPGLGSCYPWACVHLFVPHRALCHPPVVKAHLQPCHESARTTTPSREEQTWAWRTWCPRAKTASA